MGVDEKCKMKKITFVFLLTVMLWAVVAGQSPTPTPGTPFNPFQTPNRDYPTSRPTVSKEALSQVPSQTQSATTNRNSNRVVATPTPQPNNRTMSSGSEGRLIFGNGAWMIRQGDKVMVNDGGRRYFMSRKDANPPPASMRNSCRTIKHYLDTHRVDSFWRHLSIWWADNCL